MTGATTAGSEPEGAYLEVTLPDGSCAPPHIPQRVTQGALTQNDGLPMVVSKTYRYGKRSQFQKTYNTHGEHTEKTSFEVREGI